MAAQLCADRDCWRLEGVLDFASVPALVAEGAALVRTQPELIIDLAGVESTNSAGLALLLEWLDLARAQGCALCYRHLPDALCRIAALSNALSLLPLASEAEPQLECAPT